MSYYNEPTTAYWVEQGEDGKYYVMCQNGGHGQPQSISHGMKHSHDAWTHAQRLATSTTGLGQYSTAPDWAKRTDEAVGPFAAWVLHEHR